MMTNENDGNCGGSVHGCSSTPTIAASHGLRSLTRPDSLFVNSVLDRGTFRRCH